MSWNPSVLLMSFIFFLILSEYLVHSSPFFLEAFSFWKQSQIEMKFKQKNSFNQSYLAIFKTWEQWQCIIIFGFVTVMNDTRVHATLYYNLTLCVTWLICCLLIMYIGIRKDVFQSSKAKKKINENRFYHFDLPLFI